MQDRSKHQNIISFKQFLLKESKLLESLESQEARLKKIVSKVMNVYTSSLIEDKNLLVIKGGLHDGTTLEIEFRVRDEEINAGLPDHEEFEVLDIRAFEITKVYHAYKHDRESLGQISLNLDDATDDIILHAVQKATGQI